MFEAHLDKYKSLNINDKREKIISEIKLMIVVLEKMCIDNNIPYREIKSKEILALKQENYSEEDYLEALFVYVEYLKEVLGCFFYDEVNK